MNTFCVCRKYIKNTFLVLKEKNRNLCCEHMRQMEQNFISKNTVRALVEAVKRACGGYKDLVIV